MKKLVRSFLFAFLPALLFIVVSLSGCRTQGISSPAALLPRSGQVQSIDIYTGGEDAVRKTVVHREDIRRLMDALEKIVPLRQASFEELLECELYNGYHLEESENGAVQIYTAVEDPHRPSDSADFYFEIHTGSGEAAVSNVIYIDKRGGIANLQGFFYRIRAIDVRELWDSLPSAEFPAEQDGLPALLMHDPNIVYWEKSEEGNGLAYLQLDEERRTFHFLDSSLSSWRLVGPYTIKGDTLFAECDDFAFQFRIIGDGELQYLENEEHRTFLEDGTILRADSSA